MPDVTHGMDVAAVEEMGRRLQSHHVEVVRNLIRQIDSAVSGTGSTWTGADAARFRSWWPEKKARMEGIANDLHGFGQSALNNASEQRTASGADGGPIGGGVVSPTAASIGVAATQPTAATPGTGVAPGADRPEADVIAAYNNNYGRYDLNRFGAPGQENEYQCVSWAWFRMRELGYNGDVHLGNGKDVAGTLQGTRDTVPKVGAVLSRDDGSTWGHVMIAEKVEAMPDGGLRVSVSEMNTDSNGWVARPDEYNMGRILERRPDGTWIERGQPATIVVANPVYGTPRI